MVKIYETDQLEMKGGLIHKGIIQANRSSTNPATYLDKDGKIQLITQSDIARYDYGTWGTTGFIPKLKLLTEASATNYCLNSYFSLGTTLGTSWSQTITNCTITNELIASTTNEITGARSQKVGMAFTGTPAQFNVALRANTDDDSFDASGGNVNVTLTLKARGDLSGLTGGNNLWLKFVALTNAFSEVQSLELRNFTSSLTDLSSTEWREFSYSHTITETTARKVRLDICFLGSGTRPLNGESGFIEVTDVQIEKSSAKTSFIPATTTAVTRLAETLIKENETNGMSITSLSTDTIRAVNSITGGVQRAFTDVDSATYTLLETDDILGVSYSATGDCTITLPTLQATRGRTIEIADTGGDSSTNNITIATEGAETIRGGATLTIATDNSRTVLSSDGTNWF